MESRSSFGEMLKAFRLRKHLTQQELAELIGAHRNTIGIWERGSYLPESKTVVLELAHRLGLQEQETRQLLEASFTALLPYWSVPLPHNPFFTGREEILERLHTQLGADRVMALTQSSALYGLGGIGKTQIALEYAYRYGLEYSAVFWIGAETQEEILSSLLRIAEVLQLPERNEKDQQRVVAAVQRWLETSGQWLVILDNVEDLDVLTHFLPATRQGSVLITTRRQTLGTHARGLDLQPMGQEEGMLLLLRRAKLLAPEATSEEMQQLVEQMPAQYAAAAQLVELMGGLPLALDQAGAYLEATHCGLPTYLERFHEQHAALLELRGEGVQDHPASVSTTFTLAITATSQRHPAVKELLQVCAFLQPDAIPEELFRQAGIHLGASLEAACRDGLEWDRLVSAARSYSLLSRQAEEQTLSLHRLMQIMLREQVGKDEQRAWLQRVVVALNAAFPEFDHEAWRQCERLLPHVQVVADALADQEAEPELAELLRKAADYLRERAQYERAEPLYQRALRISERVLGPEHAQVASSLNGLALLYSWQGKYEQAEGLFQRVLQIREQSLGPEHLEMADSLNGLAHLFYRQGKYEQAEPLYRRALHIRERKLGLEHPEVAASLIYLAVVFAELSENEQAEELFQQALRIGERVLGPEHPRIAHQLANLAEFYKEQQKYEEAEPLYKRAIHIWEQALGPEHPTIPYPLAGLAALYMERGEYEEAEPLYQRALHIGEQALGPEHPVVASSLNGLAQLYYRQGKHEQAEPLYQRALYLREQHLGLHHPDTAQTLHDLAMLRQKQGKLDEALAFAQQALSIRAQVLGEAHPKTVATRTLYDRLLQEQAGAQEEAATGRHPEASERAKALSPQPTKADPSASEGDPLQDFLNACCDLRPRAWCRSADLWQAYERWTKDHQERFPLSRGTFATQLKAHGLRADRTNTARIWRGVALVKMSSDEE